jgi:hypothetical protein
MALHLTLVLATVHCSPANLSAIKCAYPSITVLLLASLAAFGIFCHFPTIAGRLHLLSARATKSLMTRCGTIMLATRHDISTYLATAPAYFVISLRTLFRARLLPTEATLQRAHMCTSSTGTSMANLVTRMWTSLRKHSFSSTRLPARVRRQPTHNLGVDLFLTPTRVVAGEDVFR